jgi:two-component sensor histidine kinase/PAS domain-containing protein
VSIKNRIFVSYLALISIILVYFGLSRAAEAMRAEVEADRAAVLELHTTWGATRAFLNDMVINWEDGAVYEKFRSSRSRFREQLADIRNKLENRWYYPDEFRMLPGRLSQVWEMADSHLKRVDAATELPDFKAAVALVALRPGLQRLNHLWNELLEEDTDEARRLAYPIEQLIEEVEFFPIYGGTVERIMEVLVLQAEEVQRTITRAEGIVSAVFFLGFLAVCLWIASRFAHSISKPIINVAGRVYEFAGLSGATTSGAGFPEGGSVDELALLDGTVDRMIAHYTDLADRAGRLARGEVSGDTPHFPREEVVGKSLDEIADYLHELAHTSAWIRDGEYGMQIRERSERDVITHNFNVMSAVIQEKITTLRSMFEAVDEAVLVVDEAFHVVEANTQLYRLIGTDAPDEAAERFVEERFVPGLVSETVDNPFAAQASNRYANIGNVHGNEVPVRFSSRILPETGGLRGRCMFIITDESWRARAKREQERLRAQAAIAELRALQAQINPHFFFNTLNTISHLIETDSEAAVGTVQKLADLFRYTLTATKKERVSLGEELENVRRFLDIELRRYGENLQVEYHVDDALLCQPIPPMLIQPLVENAVKYGVDDQGAVRIAITGTKEESVMVLEVADQGIRQVDIETLLTGQGTGIPNVNQRFATLFGRQLTFRRNVPRGLVASLRIPVQQQ